MPQVNPLRVAYARAHPDELAALLAGIPLDELLGTLRDLPADACAAVIARLPHPVSVRLLASQSDETVAAWLAQAPLDDALTLVMHLADERRGRILATLPIRHMRRTLERLVVYPQQTVGALVDPTVVRVSATTELAEAVNLLRAGDQQELEWIWIVDAESRYVGLLDLSRALLARSERVTVGELAVPLTALRAETALAAARDVSEWLKHPELPVVDHQHHLLGALSRERLMTALAASGASDYGFADSLSALTQAYFRVLGACLAELLGTRGR